MTDCKSFGGICTYCIVFIVYKVGRCIYNCCALNHQISKLQIENVGSNNGGNTPGSISPLAVLWVISYGKLFMVCVYKIFHCNLQT